ncbi:Zinc finger protein 543 [Portunus trituberculatus]|uniref:Zinc finger protein 543 n=1 Tax=Portunus trituberculatus TaxID=210409 RepID=A0A5B7DDY6_PORTR|nr:Zinc finger protein 543 [Portunus trituberculatus]
MTETQRRVSLQWRITGVSSVSGACGLVGAVPAGDSCKRKHPCAYCGKLFLRRSHAKQHQRRHTGDQPYSCQICNKKFVHKSHYTYHVTRSLEHHTRLKSLNLGLGGDANQLHHPQQHQYQQDQHQAPQ